ncbi:helix-turn-helix domain-containing protein [Paenarthrobacter sp. NPDC090520]|uniref:helix-turn-helix domain-containing protein n=1 Tax=Paenarthrobacter sp. NPDC090520 TaxID=3364382 RepID=UPI00380EBC71
MDRDPSEWSFATDARAVAEESWGRMLSENHLNWSLDELMWDGPTFSASVRRRAIGDLFLVDCECDASSGHRGPEEIAASSDAYLVLLMTISGQEIVEQAGQQCSLTPGSVVVWDSESDAAFAVGGRLKKRSLIMPKTTLAEVGVRGRLQTGRVLDHRAPTIKLLAHYLESVSQGIDDIPLGAIPAVRNATLELVAAALQASPSPSATSPEAIMGAAQSYIEANLRNPGLAPAPIAAALGVSLRTLHRAFEESPLSVSELIRVQRLVAARDDILGGSSISSVARRWQFSDPSHFSRSFKRHFGVAPSEIRVLN